MERPGLVATDVDGTLLDPTERVPDRTRAVVHRVISAGVPFVLVTGRPPRWIPPIVEQLGYAGTTVCANGAVVYDAATDRIRHAMTLAPELLRHAADALSRALPGARLAVELPVGRAALNGGGPFLAEPGYTHPWPGADCEAASREMVLCRPALKLLVRLADAASDTMAVAVEEILGAHLDVTFSSGHGLIELSAPGVTKGSGLARVAGELGVPPEEVVAFGDMPNDVSMLQWAGWGVAMANAHAAVLEAADEVTAPNSEEGLALVLERWF